MKNLLIILLFYPFVSFGQSPFTNYYENGRIQLAGESLEEIIEYQVSSISGLNVRESPDLKSKVIGEIPYRMSVEVKSKTGLKLTLIVTDKESGIKSEVTGEWIEVTGIIVVEYDKENIDHKSVHPKVNYPITSDEYDAYYKDDNDITEGEWMDFSDIERDSVLSRNQKRYQNPLIKIKVRGYVFDGFLEKNSKSIRKGVWTSYSESGNIIRESFYGVKVFKTIEYDTDGNITSIGEESIEFDEGIFGPNTVNNTFYKNGKIKCMEESSSGGALSYCFDENGKIIDNDGNLEEPSDRFKDLYFLSKNIRTHSPYFTSVGDIPHN